MLLESFSHTTIHFFKADSHVLAASPDGSVSAEANSFGTISVYECEIRRLLIAYLQ